MSEPLVKIVIYVPAHHAAKMRKVLGEAGAGKIGSYDFCSFSSPGTGRFRANEQANPSVGKIGILTTVEEERIEVVCPEHMVKSVVQRIRLEHPYEEPAIDIIPLWNDRY